MTTDENQLNATTSAPAITEGDMDELIEHLMWDDQDVVIWVMPIRGCGGPAYDVVRCNAIEIAATIERQSMAGIHSKVMAIIEHRAIVVILRPFLTSDGVLFKPSHNVSKS
jgi:hypothetical protein